MQKIRHIVLALLLLLGSLPLHAQWLGSLEGQGGFGWLPQRDEELDSPLHHARGQLGAQVTFRKPTLVWTSNLNGSYTYKEHASYTPDTSEEKMGLYMEKPNTVSHMVAGGFRTTQWLGSPGRVLKGELTVERNLRDQTSIWVKMDASETDFTANVYRITPKTDRRLVTLGA